MIAHFWRSLGPTPVVIADFLHIAGASPDCDCQFLQIIRASPNCDCRCFTDRWGKPRLFAHLGHAPGCADCIEGRHGPEMPDCLHQGDIYLFFDAGKDRRRIFTNALKVQKGAKDPQRNLQSKIMLYCTEASVRARRGRARGVVKLTQGIHIIRNQSTKIQARAFKVHSGSTHSDVFGPVCLDNPKSIPMIPKASKQEWWGKRMVRAGGRCDASDEDDGDDDNDDEPQDDEVEPGNDEQAPGEDQVPISYHCLPVSVITDFVEALGVKHVIDLTPSPLGIGAKLLELGCSYFALCASEVMRDKLKLDLTNAVASALMDPNNPLHDRRFASVGKPSKNDDREDPDDPEPEDPQPEDPEPEDPKPSKGGGKGKGKGNKGKGKGKGNAKGKKGDPGNGGLDLAALLAQARLNLANGGDDPNGGDDDADDGVE